MKKNKMLRLASVLLVCVLLTTSVIGGTFAKYTTKATLSGEARVAKWGVTFTAGSDLFETSYKDPGNTTVTVQVETSDTKNLVAPGTSGESFVVSASDSTPEVSYEVKIKLADGAKVPTLKYTPAGDTTSETTYEPVKFSVYNGTTPIASAQNLTLNQMKSLFDGTKIIYKYDVSATGNKYYFNANLDNEISDEEKTSALTAAPEIKIKWEWAFSGNENDADQIRNSQLDTILGDLAAGIVAESNGTLKTGYKLPTDVVKSVNADATNGSILTVDLDWTMTATQID